MDKKTLNRLTYNNESMFQVVDSVTRSTGRLTKLLRIIDMNNTRLRKISYKYTKQDAAAAKVMEDFYPQLLGMVCAVNCPGWLDHMWNILCPLFPSRVVKKWHFLPSVANMKKSKEDLKPILRYVSQENLPNTYEGQNNEWPLPVAGEHFAAMERDTIGL